MTETERLVELLPCPFCGEADTELINVEGQWPAVRCLNCGALGPCVSVLEAESKDKWNRRYESRRATQNAASPPSDSTVNDSGNRVGSDSECQTRTSNAAEAAPAQGAPTPLSLQNARSTAMQIMVDTDKRLAAERANDKPAPAQAAPHAELIASTKPDIRSTPSQEDVGASVDAPDIANLIEELPILKLYDGCNNNYVQLRLHQAADAIAALTAEHEQFKIDGGKAIQFNKQRAESAEAALSKINNIRNSIIGLQKINWSEHIYPLVAALNEAGIVGMKYPEAFENFGTMLERMNKAEAEIARLTANAHTPEGTQTVPSEPTIAMIDAGFEEMISDRNKDFPAQRAVNVYKAMLADAPKAGK